MDHVDNNKDDSKAESKRTRKILRFDEVFDVNASQTRLIPSVKSARKKQKSQMKFLVVRRQIDGKGLHTGTEVDIKSESVAQLMRDINADVEGISLLTNPPVVPLELFYHNRLILQEKLDEAKNAVPVNESIVLDLVEVNKFVEEEYGEHKARLEPLHAEGEITWEDMWTIFPPNVLVYRYHNLVEQDQIMKFRTMSMATRYDKSRYWDLSCHVVADDGAKFGLADEYYGMEIDEFVGTRKISDLPLYPLSFKANAAQLHKEALERGRRFADLSKPRIMKTSGSAMSEKRDGGWKPHCYKFMSHGRVIVDPPGFRYFNSNTAFTYKVHRNFPRTGLTDEQLVICTPVILGFSFGDKKWGGFAMARLVDITWNMQAFQDLVMDEERKKMIHSLVKQHSAQDDEFDDIIMGKGKGMICLFSGPPGCGKTLTAEAVAEVTKRPLYSVSAGDLGVDAYKVDENLSRILNMTENWNAVLLIDEADVFLEQRTQNDIGRNAIVSIFLRQLEYFQGILILTTNRIVQCDMAFNSRIHVKVSYPELDERAREVIWKTFLMKAGTSVAVNVSDEDVSRLAQIPVNGRQIKNIVGCARAIAKESESLVSVDHIHGILRVTSSWPTDETPMTNGIHKQESQKGDESSPIQDLSLHRTSDLIPGSYRAEWGIEG